MADLMDTLAEAQIRDWQRRREAGEVMPSSDGLKVESWEGQLMKEIIRLRRAARLLPKGEERSALESIASNLHIQLMVVVERDRPMLAQTLAKNMARAVNAD